MSDVTVPTHQPEQSGGQRRFWVFWSALTTSSVGSAVTAVAIPLTAVTAIHATPVQIGIIAGASYVAWAVIGLPAGVIANRLPMRGLQVAMDLVRAAALLSIPVAWAFDALTWWHLALAALVLGFANVLFDVINSVFMTEVVSAADLQRRNSLISGTEATTSLGGPTIGGLLVQLLGPVYTVLVDVVSYVVSAVLLRSLPAVPPRGSATSGQGIWSQIRDGYHYVVRHPVIGPSLVAATMFNFTAGAHMALFSLYLVRTLDAPPGIIGLLLASEGLGALIGASFTTRLSKRWGTAGTSVFAAASALFGALLIASLTGVGGYLTFVVGTTIYGSSVVVFSVLARTYRQVSCPKELLSRVMATVRFFSWGVIPLGSLVAGFGAEWLGARAMILLAGTPALVALVTLRGSAIGRHRDLADVPVADHETKHGSKHEAKHAL